MSSSRQTLYSAQQATSAQTMQQERDAAKSLFRFIQDAFGSTNGYFAGLAATPGTGLTVNIGTGALYQNLPIDPTAWSTLSADTSAWTLQGLLTAAQTLSGFAAPGTAGQSINYLIQGKLVVTDSANVSTNFYNSTTPGTPTVLSKSPSRQNVVTLAVKAGTAAATGSQTTPAADAGYIPMWQVTVANGAVSITSGNISLAPSAPQFSGFVLTNPLGNTPVYLSPASQQTGFINVSGNITTAGTIIAGTSLLGPSAVTVSGYSSAFLGGLTGDKLNVSGTQTMNGNTNASIAIAGAIAYSGTHAGTDADPYPVSQLNVAMLGGKVASDYALASGNYVTVYAGTPTLATGNAGVTGYLQSGVATGTAPLIVASTTQVANLNASLLGGYAAGNANGNVPVSNGTLNANLNAQFLNGLASSAFQLAGSYATMNATNTGYFTATGNIATTGGSGSNQTTLAYAATNGFNLNSGGPLAYLQANSAPLGLIGSTVYTNAPLNVGGGNPQNLSAKDIVPSGLVRAGLLAYRVSYSTTNPMPTPGASGVSDFGYEMTVNGALDLCFDAASATAFYVGFRCMITLASPLTVAFNSIGNQGVGLRFYIDGVLGGANRTIPAGTHTIDIVYASFSMGLEYYLGSTGIITQQGGNVKLFGWIPYSGGQMSSAITAFPAV